MSISTSIPQFAILRLMFVLRVVEMSQPKTPCFATLGYVLTIIFVVSCFTGCSSVKYWWTNNAKIGPNYWAPDSPIASTYTDHRQDLVNVDSRLDPQWWTVFNDPDLNLLVESVFAENLTLKSAAWRIAESRAQRNIAAANLFPQSQAATGSYVHNQSSTNADGFAPFIPITTDNWSVGFDAAWELDLWGRIRRSIDSADANYQANVADYDFILVTLIGDVATLYINVRSIDERLNLAQKNIKSLQGSLDIAQRRFDAGRTSKLDVLQAESNLAATEALIPQLELAQRQSLNAMAVLLGVPPSEISFLSNKSGHLPEVPSSAIVGIPAELLTQRPDIRAA
ncbi:MAG: TolC family protein, partial [Planctomycetota bacterium]